MGKPVKPTIRNAVTISAHLITNPGLNWEDVCQSGTFWYLSLMQR